MNENLLLKAITETNEIAEKEKLPRIGFSYTGLDFHDFESDYNYHKYDTLRILSEQLKRYSLPCTGNCLSCPNFLID